MKCIGCIFVWRWWPSFVATRWWLSWGFFQTQTGLFDSISSNIWNLFTEFMWDQSTVFFWLMFRNMICLRCITDVKMKKAASSRIVPFACLTYRHKAEAIFKGLKIYLDTLRYCSGFVLIFRDMKENSLFSRKSKSAGRFWKHIAEGTHKV